MSISSTSLKTDACGTSKQTLNDGPTRMEKSASLLTKVRTKVACIETTFRPSVGRLDARLCEDRVVLVLDRRNDTLAFTSSSRITLKAG
jgi:hypothetical protein